jgi:multiple sugar transport system substrate-binding protein
MQHSFIRRVALAGLCIFGLVLTACGGSSNSGPVKLTFWGYNDEITQQCDLFNKSQSKIQMTCLKKPSSNNSFIPPLLTALKAGNGPDVALIEYMFIPLMLANNDLVDLSKYGANDVKDQFQPNAWGQVSYGSAVYGLPQDTGPQQLYYNKKVYQQAGITAPPKTWDEFYIDAQKIHALGPDHYITAFNPTTDAWFESLFWQAGAIWFTIDNNKWKVNINSDASKKVAAYWEKMVKEGLVDTATADADFQGGWGKALNGGQISSWIAPVWGSSVISGDAADQKGNWAIAEMPQWSAGQHVSSMWGGSGISVMATSKHPAEAAQFVKWYLTDSGSQQIGVNKIGWWTSHIASNNQLNKAPNDYYGGQTTSDGVQNVTIDGSWKFPPNLTQVDNFQNDLFNAAINNKTSFSDVLDQMQTKVVQDLKNSGYPVE